MQFRKSKSLSSISADAGTPCKCPKTGRRLETGGKYHWLVWACPILGLVSLIWFLIRVIPKPSRALYPCQRVAAPLAGGFVIWISGLLGSAFAYRKARHFLYQSRYMVAALCIVLSVLAVWLSLSVSRQATATAAFTPIDPPNSPIGAAKGIHPGRVVWVHDPEAANWDGQTGNWWDDENTDQDAVDIMLSKSIQGLTGQTSDPNAWDALFRHFNLTRGFGDISYQRGEKIAIKINMNQENSSGGNWSSTVGNPSPQVIYSLLKQLINVVGVPGSAITIYDASRYIGNPIYNKVRNNPDPNFQAVSFVVRNNLAASGRLPAVYDTANPLYTKSGIAYLPTCVTGAKYLINMALLRPHSLFGVTLCAKNHFGSTYFPTGGGWTPSPMHNYGQRTNPMASYNCLVNLNGHRQLSGKTLLYLIDGLYPARNQSSEVIRWVSFGGDWFSSMLASQDPVAIDSVGLDFLRYEDSINPAITDVTGNPDNYLHEAALADNPPSGTSYDPEGDGMRLASLGVHEHWNNSIERLYSRNLGTGDGIELVMPSFAVPDGPIENTATGKRYERIRHSIADADPGDKIIVRQGVYSESINFYGKNLTLSSTDPNDRAVVAATVIAGVNRGVTFSSGEDNNSVLTGLTITAAETGIYCSGSSPVIANCRVEYNTGAGIKLQEGSNPLIAHCSILANAGDGIRMLDKTLGRIPTYNCPAVANCVVAGNGLDGIIGGMPAITNCTIVENSGRGISSYRPTIINAIVYYNALATGSVQIDSQVAPAVTYSDVQGGWPGEGNIDVNPDFVELGFWNLNGTPEYPGDDIWISGDYHLQSQAGRWDCENRTWVQDTITSPCIDAGDPAFDCASEPPPNGGRVNMGAYGGTSEASMSP